MLRSSRALLAVCALVLLWPGVCAQHRRWRPQDFPNPQTDPAGCNRTAASFFCDPDGLVAQQAAGQLDDTILKVSRGAKPYAQAACGSAGLVGFKVAAAVMHRKETDLSAAGFAAALLEPWGVGDALCDNGMVVVLSALEQQIDVSVGAGVLKYLPLERIHALVHEATQKDMADKRYGAALEAAIDSYAMALAAAVSGGGAVSPSPSPGPAPAPGPGPAPEPTPGPTPPHEHGDLPGWLQFLLHHVVVDEAVGAVLVAAFLWYRKWAHGGRQGSRTACTPAQVEALAWELQSVSSGALVASACDACCPSCCVALDTRVDPALLQSARGTCRWGGGAASGAAAAAVPTTAVGPQRVVPQRDLLIDVMDTDGPVPPGPAAAGGGGAGSGSSGGSGGTAARPAAPSHLDLAELLSSGATPADAAGTSAAGSAGTAAPPCPTGADAGAAVQPLLLPCGHVACSSCMGRRLARPQPTCPTCLAPVDTASLQRTAASTDGSPQPPAPWPPSSVLRRLFARSTHPSSASAAAAAHPASADRGAARDLEQPLLLPTEPAAPSSITAGSSCARSRGSTGEPGAVLLDALHQRWVALRLRLVAEAGGDGARLQALLVGDLEARLVALRQTHPAEGVQLDAWLHELRSGRPLSAQQLLAAWTAHQRQPSDSRLHAGPPHLQLQQQQQQHPGVQAGGGGGGGGGPAAAAWLPAAVGQVVQHAVRGLTARPGGVAPHAGGDRSTGV